MPRKTVTPPETHRFDYDRFYRVGEGFRRSAVRVKPRARGVDAYALTRGELRPRRALVFDHAEGTKLFDLIGTTLAVIRIVSDRFVAALEGFSGWRTFPVELHDAKGDVVDGYHGLSATGRSGTIDDALSPVEVLPPAAPGGSALPHLVGLRFDPDTWDGSDVFAPAGMGFVFVTADVRDALVAAKVTNVDLERITEITMLVLDDDGDDEPFA